jgi:hypothetical protein
VIFQVPTLAVYYDEQERADRRLAKRKKVTACWPPPEYLALIYRQKLEDEN